jgi:DNA-binding response OmpR family regulator
MHMTKTSILVADDDAQLLRLVTRNLQLEGYDVLAASNGQQALEEIERAVPDLVLLDVMMPKVDGFAVLERVREFSAVPVVMLTARGLEQDKVLALDLGADDYLAKPFSVEELLARVRAVLRRSHFSGTKPTRAWQSTINTGALTIDTSRREVTKAGKVLSLTPTEYGLVASLSQQLGRIVPQEVLIEQVWGVEYLGESHLLQVNINRLRHKIEDDPAHPRYLLTRSGVGYELASLPPIGESSA